MQCLGRQEVYISARQMFGYVDEQFVPTEQPERALVLTRDESLRAVVCRAYGTATAISSTYPLPACGTGLLACRFVVCQSTTCLA